MSSTAVVGIAATEIAASPSTAMALAPVSPVLSVGFAESGDAETTRIISADRLLVTDSHFRSAGARVTVHGLWCPESRRQRASGVLLTTFFNSGHERVPFIAWSGVSGAPVSFRVPVDDAGSLPIGIQRRGTQSILEEPARRLSSIFSAARAKAAAELPAHETMERNGSLCKLVTSGEGLKLRRGAYFIALREHAWDRTPNWSSLSLAGNVRNVRSESILRHGNGAVDFDYLVVSVDYA